MANTYSGDPRTSQKDAVRFILSDTKEPWLFTDEEIIYEIDLMGSTYGAAADLASVMAGRYTDKADKTVGPLSISYSKMSERWSSFERSLLNRARKSSGAKAIMTQSSTKHIFGIGMHDNSGNTSSSSSPDDLLGTVTWDDFNNDFVSGG